jgi:hypothetical protein
MRRRIFSSTLSKRDVLLDHHIAVLVEQQAARVVDAAAERLRSLFPSAKTN